MADRKLFANAVFFPAAALHASVVLPWSVLALTGKAPAPPGLLSAGGHAHEMLFGYALAVVAGYLLGPQPLARVLALFACWLLARLAFLWAPASPPAFVFSGLFAALVALWVMPRFLKSAKKWRNRTVAPVIGALGLCAAAAAWLVGRAPGPALLVLRETVLLLAVLLFFMGGRIIAPAVAGFVIRRGGTLSARVQPRIEGTVLVLLGLTLLLAPWVPALSGWLLMAAGVLVTVRWLRWRPWRCLGRPDLLALLSGYLWLALGLLLMGASRLTPAIAPVAATHAVTAGALGTLSLVVMMRTRLLYRFRDANRMPLAHLAAVLVQLAALARVLAPMAGADRHWLLVAAGLWSLAFLLCLAVLLRTLGKTAAARGDTYD